MHLTGLLAPHLREDVVGHADQDGDSSEETGHLDPWFHNELAVARDLGCSFVLLQATARIYVLSFLSGCRGSYWGG